MEVGVVARVLHDFFTTKEGELSVTVGQIVQVVAHGDKFWCYALSCDKYGNVPTKCLMAVDTPAIDNVQEVFVAHANFASAQKGDLSFSKGDLIVGVREIDANWWEGKIDDRTGIFPITYTWKLDSTILKAKAKNKCLSMKASVKMDMKAMLEDEMDLFQGEIVTITEIVDKNWYRGFCGDRSGSFPSAYVQIISDLATDYDNQNPSNQYCNTTTVETPETPPLISFSPEKTIKKVSSMSADELHDVFNDDYFKLNMPTVFRQNDMQGDPHAGSSIPVVFQREEQNVHNNAAKNSNYESQLSTELDVEPYGITLYDFYGQFENELSFHEGELVKLIRHIDNFWIEGTFDGKKGIFPSSYVEILVDCEEQPREYTELPSPTMEVLLPNSFACVLYNFDAPMDGNLHVTEKQVVQILNQLDDDWCEIKDRMGNVGLCPRNHLAAYSKQPSDRSSVGAYQHSDKTTSANTVKLQRSLSISTERPHCQMYPQPVRNLSVTTDLQRRESFDRSPHRPAPPIPVPGQKLIQRELRKQQTPCSVVVEEKSKCDEIEELASNRESQIEDCRKKNLEQRQNVISELVFTEKEYVRDLKITYETFNLHNPSILEARGIDVKTVFGNILEVMHQAENLLDSLQLAMKGKDNDDQCIGPCFLKVADELKDVYGEYCMNHDHALTLLEKYEDSQEIQNLFEKGLETLRYQIACFNMGSILIKPVQRILKYPLILNELIKSTDKCHQDVPKLIEAVKTMTQVATYINECKRRKDIVSKYLEDGNATISRKMSRISFHSVAKKSSRLSVLLTSTLGFGIATKDPVFDEHETMFYVMVKTINSFAHNIEGLSSCLHEEIMMELDIAQCIAHFYQESNIIVEQFQAIQTLVNDNFWPHFKQMVEMRVETPISILIELFQGPSILVQKRHDKLLDYDGCLAKAEKNKENRLIQEELFAAKSNYEALNSHLLEELPLLTKLSRELFIECLGEFVNARKLLSGKITKQYLSLIEMPLMKCSQGNPLETFSVKHSLVLNQYSRFSFSSKNVKTDTLSKRVNQRSPTPSLRSLPPETSHANAQSSSQQSYLKSRYPASALYRVVQPFKASQSLELTVGINHLVAVIKRQNPMGDASLWYVDDGAVQGFLPSKCLEPIFLNEVSAMDANSLNEITSTPSSSLREMMSTPSSNYGSKARSLQNTPMNSGSEANAVSTSKSKIESQAPPSYDQVVDQDLYAEKHRYTEIQDVSTNYTPARYEEVPEEEAITEFYYALFDFQGENANALSIRSGQVLSVISKQDLQENKEWWFVEDRFGAKGYVPGNFLSKYNS